MEVVQHERQPIVLVDWRRGGGGRAFAVVLEGGDGRFKGEGATLLYVDVKKGKRNARSLRNVIG
jgi:hypothetical protein